MSAEVADIQISASLIDHYLQLQDAPVGEGVAGRFVAVQDTSQQPPATHLLTADSDGNLLHFRPDQASHSGWSTSSFAVLPPPDARTGTIVSLQAFFCNGMLNAIVGFLSNNCWANYEGYFPNVAAWLVAQGDGTWLPIDLTGEAAGTFQNCSAAAFTTPGGTNYVYGANWIAEGSRRDPNVIVEQFVLSYVDATGEWRQCPLPDSTTEVYDFGPASDAPLPVNLIAGQDDTLIYQLMTIDGASGPQWGEYVVSQPGTENTSFQLQLSSAIEAPSTNNPFITLPGKYGRTSVLLIDDSQTLVQMMRLADPVFTPLTGSTNAPGGVLQACACLDGSGALSIFAVGSTDHRLWILRQSGTDEASGAPSFGSWVCLGNTAEAITCPPVVAGGPELFLVDPQLNVYHMVQNLTDRVWTTAKVAAPTPSTASPQRVAATMMVVSAVDASGVPVPNAVLSVAADAPTVLVADDLAYLAGPGQPAAIPTDAVGQASVYVQTAGLAVPPLTFTAGDASRWCQGDVVEVKSGETAPPVCPASIASRLAGQDPEFAVTPSALADANLLARNYSEHAKDAVQTINTAGQWMLQNAASPAGELDLSGVRVPHWQVDFTQPDGPRFRVLTEVEAGAICASVDDGGLPGGFFSFFGDAVNWLKHAWNEIESITASVVEGGIQFVINRVKYLVTTVRQAAAAVELIFARLVQGLKDVYDDIEAVIDWLKQLFGWDDILATHTAIKAGVLSLADQVQVWCKEAPALLNHWDTETITKITDAFGKMQTALGTRSFNEYAGAASGSSPALPQTASPLAGQLFHDGYTQHKARCQYVFSNARSHFLIPTAARSTEVPRFITVMKEQWPQDQFTTHTTSLWTYLTDKLGSTVDFHALFDLAITDLLQAIKELLEFLIDGASLIASAAADVLGGAIHALMAKLTSTINIPVISWLYKYVITGTPTDPGDTLTILDLLCLVLAVPTTILGKVMLGQAPISAAQAASVSSALVWPSMSGPVAHPGAAGAVDPALLRTLGEVCGLLYGVSGLSLVTLHSLALSDADDVAPLKALISGVIVVCNIANKSLGAPIKLFQQPSPWSAADVLSVELWAASCVPVFVGGFSVANFWTELDCWSQEGPVLNTGLGVILSVLGLATLIVQAVDGKPGWTCANSLVPQLGRCFSFLVLFKDSEAAPVAAAALIVADVVFGLGSVMTKIESSAA